MYNRKRISSQKKRAEIFSFNLFYAKRDWQLDGCFCLQTKIMLCRTRTFLFQFFEDILSKIVFLQILTYLDCKLSSFL